MDRHGKEPGRKVDWLRVGIYLFILLVVNVLWISDILVPHRGQYAQIGHAVFLLVNIGIVWYLWKTDRIYRR